MKYYFYFLLCLLTIYSCIEKDFFEGPNQYEDGFENYQLVEELFDGEDKLWSFSQLTRNENMISIDSLNAHSGTQSLKFYAYNSRKSDASKCSVAKQKMAFWNDETVRITAWYYLQGTEDHEWLFLMDLEEQVAIGAGPGMRIAMVDNKLRVEYKFFENDVLQNPNEEINFPRDKWVKITFETKLSQNNNGSVKLYQDELLIIDRSEIRTLPNDLLYAQQGTKGMYSSVELGITANSQDNELTLWVDDVLIEKVK